MNRKKLIVISILLFAGISLLLVFTQKPNVNHVKTPVLSNVSSDLIGATNIKRFSDIYNRSSSSLQNNRNIQARPAITPKPLPYPRITISYSLQRTNSIRGISAGANNTFILVSVDIRNYGYKYFDADPNKFRLDTLEPTLNVNTGNMLNEVLPNNSETQGSLVFLISNKQRYSSKLVYTEGYTIIYHFGGSSVASGGQSVASIRRNYGNNTNYD